MKEYQMFEPMLVEWRDAYHDFEWPDINIRIFRDYIVKTNGFYVCHDKTWLHLTMEILPEGDGLRGYTHIPLVLLQTINGEKA